MSVAVLCDVHGSPRALGERVVRVREPRAYRLLDLAVAGFTGRGL